MVRQGIEEIIKIYLKTNLLVFIGTVFIAYFFFLHQLATLVIAQVLSFIYVSSSYIIIKDVHNVSNSVFYRRFLTTIALRFVLIIISLLVILTLLKFNRIYFTVGFIISYILHSATEMYTINKIVQTDN